MGVAPFDKRKEKEWKKNQSMFQTEDGIRLACRIGAVSYLEIEHQHSRATVTDVGQLLGALTWAAVQSSGHQV